MSRNKFYKNSTSAKISSCSNWQGRITEYYLEDGLELHSSNKKDIDITVGDSISKKMNSWEFEVFKKDAAGTYKLNNVYDYSKH